jgi:serine/threonine-protein kinase
MEGPPTDPIPFLVSDFNEGFPTFSPDGRWLAYVSGETGQAEVFVREIVAGDLTGGVRRRVSRGGGRHPVWARDGSELFYLSDDCRRILGTAIKSAPGLVLGDEREVLTDLTTYWEKDVWGTGGVPFDVGPDGERLLVLSLIRDPEAAMRIVVVLDWVAELDRIAPRR